jgi:hypothetical protein
LAFLESLHGVVAFGDSLRDFLEVVLHAFHVFGDLPER